MLLTGILIFFYVSVSAQIIKVTEPSYSSFITDQVKYKLVDDQWEENGVHDSMGWITNERNALNIGMKRKGVWLRFTLDDQVNDSMVLLIENPFIDRAELYYRIGRRSIMIAEGGLSYEHRGKDSYPSLKFKTEQVPHEYYLYVRSELEPTISLWLHAPEQYQQSYETRLSYFFLLTGIFGVIFLYNLFLCFSIRDMVYVYYSIYVVATYFAQTTMASLGYTLLGTDSLFPNGGFVFIAVGSVAMLSRFFLTSFFERDFDKPGNRRIKWIFNSFLVVGASIVVFSFIFPPFYVFWYMNFAMMILAFLILYSTVYMTRNGVKRARFILMAWTPFLLGAIFFSLTNAGVLQYSFIAQYSMSIGACLETVLLSFALGFRIKELEQQKQRSEVYALEQTNKFQGLELDMVRTKLMALQSQMNPHFIFNALNSVQHSVLQNNLKRSKVMIQEFAKLMRIMLVNARSESVRIEDELDFITTYLQIEKNRKNDLFDFQIDMADVLIEDGVSIPPAMIQPVCENAIKHAFVNEDGKNNLIHVSILPGEVANTINVTIRDNGVGYTDHRILSNNQSLGLSIIRERIALLKKQGRTAILSIATEKDAEESGTIVRMVLPIID
jgi:sensor histidine kinase YesM